jgi:ribosomal protein S18 acetylase RimI-like enzyme
LTNDLRSLLSERGVSELVVDDLKAEDLAELAWAGDAAHLRSIQTKLLAVAQGQADYLAVRAPAGAPLAIGLIDYALSETEAEVGQLAVQPQLQGMGLGTHLIAQAEVRIRARGKQWAVMGVETGHKRTRTLYERLGYTLYDRKPDSWLIDDDQGGVRLYETEVLMLRKSVVK